jgi:hypothetical protein
MEKDPKRMKTNHTSHSYTNMTSFNTFIFFKKEKIYHSANLQNTSYIHVISMVRTRTKNNVHICWNYHCGTRDLAWLENSNEDFFNTKTVPIIRCSILQNIQMSCNIKIEQDKIITTAAGHDQYVDNLKSPNFLLNQIELNLTNLYERSKPLNIQATLKPTQHCKK